uniref:Uncharacterized protein n=1 Tax=Amphiprion ocellaris TaxID=80972 RepID=A0AAQ5ZKX6_AMPOC
LLYDPFYTFLDFHHTILSLHHQLLSLLGHHGIGVHHGSVGHHGSNFWGQDGGPQVPRPVGAGECGEVLGQSRHTEGLVKDAAALVPVTEWVPAGGAEQGERNMSLTHDGCVQAAEECCCVQMKSSLASLKMFTQCAVCLSAGSLYTH